MFGLLRDNYDPDAAAYIANVESADGQPLEAEVKRAIVRFVKGCKHDGIWSAIKASCILAGARTLTGALVPLAGTAPTNINFVAGDYNRKTGLKGDGSTKTLDTNRANNADPQNSKHIGVWVTERDVTLNHTLIAIPFATDFTALTIENSSTINVAMNQSGPFSVSNAVGFVGGNRFTSTGYEGRGGGVTISGGGASNPPTGVNLFVLSTSINMPNNFSVARIAFYSIGETLNLAMLDNRISILMNAFNTYIA